MFLLHLALTAFAAPPTDLDDLVALAVERAPEIDALRANTRAASARARAVSKPMDPQLMLGVAAIGAMPDAADPTMAMVGATQMLRGWGEGRAQARRNDLEGDRIGADSERLVADLRLQLWQLAARLGALQELLLLLDEQVRGAKAAGEVALARYGSAALVGPAMSPMGSSAPMGAEAMAMGIRPPEVDAASGGGMGMPGMGGAARGSATSTQISTPSDAPMPMSGAPAQRSMSADSGGLSALLALQAEIARVEADRAALQAERDGEVAVLSVLVGAQGAVAVSDAPASFFGAVPSSVPERRLAEIDRQIAASELQVAKTARRPDLMVSVAERLMPDGMPAGTDVALGVEIPLWSSRSAEIDAARADLDAATARADSIERDLTVATARAAAALTAAELRSVALDSVAVPKARAAWDASLALFAAGTADQGAVLRAWQTWISVEREAVLARRDVQMREAELARVQGE